MEMMRASSRGQRALAGIFLAVIMGFMGSIGLRFFTRIVLVRRLGVTNAFTRALFFDNAELNDPKNMKKRVGINWEELYPFPGDEKQEPSSMPVRERYLLSVASLVDRIENYTTSHLMGYTFFREMAKKYEDCIDYNFPGASGFNQVTKLADGHLVKFFGKMDMSEMAKSIITLSTFCRSNGINFLYVSPIHKICKFEDAMISGVLDFSNQNEDELLQKISTAGVDYYDLRQALHDDGMRHHEAFYRTDYHWRGETGLWVAHKILQLFQGKYHYSVDPSLLNADKFRRVIYHNAFLGGEGKIVTLLRTTPEDFSLLYPRYPTSLHYEQPELGIDIKGDFSILYDMSQLEIDGYYNNKRYAYNAYSYGGAVSKLTNQENVGNDLKLLLIHDCFAQTVAPFLAMGIKTIDGLVCRSFNGSVQNYIISTKPDVVIVMHYLEPRSSFIDWESHTDPFDFR